MKKQQKHALIIAGVIFCSVYVYLVSFIIPNGIDVDRALRVQEQVAMILTNSGYHPSHDINCGNVVMMSEKRGKLAVTIGNPKPGEYEIYNVIYSNRDKIDGKSLDVTFKDAQMKTIQKYHIQISP